MRTIVHLSDLHFGRTDPAVLEPLRRCVEGLRPHLVVVSGDLTQRAKSGQFREAKAFLDTLPRPQLIVPGNHDVPLYNVAARFLAPLARYKKIVTADLDPAFIDDEIAVVGVNTARSLVFKGGRINEKQVAAVRERICGLPESVTKVLVTHHPFDAGKESEEDQIVGRARMALQQLADCGADLLLAGHLHETNVSHTADRYCIDGLSALVVQAGTATSTRHRGNETNSFNALRLTPNHIEVDRYSFQEGDFKREATWAFDHDGKGWHAGEIGRG